MPVRRHLRTILLPTVVAALLAASAASGPAVAANKLEGYYEAEVAMERQDGSWHFGAPSSNGIPRHYAELKWWSWPNDNLEMFFKLRAENNRDDDRTARVDYYHPSWLAAEGHLKLRGGHYEAYLFSRQNRFWINDEPLLSLIHEDKLKNDDWGPKAQGLRVDFWDVDVPGVPGLGGTLIYSDNGGTYTWPGGEEQWDGEDAWIARLRQRSWSERLEFGATFLRKDWTDTGNEGYRSRYGLMRNNIYAADVAFFPRNLVETGLYLGPLNLEQSRLTAELAVSETPFRERVFGESERHNRAIAAEVRDIHVGDLILHGWYLDFGENFRDYLSRRFDDDRQYNRVQTHGEAIWLVPRKAVTAKLVYDHYRKRVPDEPVGGLRPTTEWYGELYMEFVNGFKGRVAHRRWRGFDASAEVNDFYTYPDWYAEVSVENFLAKIRLQARIKDAGTFRELTAYGFDMNVNITERLKGYLRMLNVNEQIEARHTMFAQVKYDIGMGAEFYFEYGDPGQSDNLVYTDWYVNEDNGDNLRDRIKLLVKTWF